jgi:hypothetical protein
VSAARTCGAVTLCLSVATTWTYGQGLGTVAAKEKAKREQAASKPAATRYDDASLKAPSGASPSGATTPSSSEESAASGAVPAGNAPTDAGATVALPVCAGFEMLRAWSEAHQKYAKECGGGPKEGTSGRFNIELVVSAAGTVEEATVTPETPYTTCVAGRMRGHSMPVPADGKRCRAPYQAMWNL